MSAPSVALLLCVLAGKCGDPVPQAASLCLSPTTRPNPFDCIFCLGNTAQSTIFLVYFIFLPFSLSLLAFSNIWLGCLVFVAQAHASLRSAEEDADDDEAGSDSSDGGRKCAAAAAADDDD